VADKDAEQPTSETVSSRECPLMTLANCTLIARRPSFFQAGHIPSWRGSCERYALLPVADVSRWLLLLLSPLLSAPGSVPYLRGLPSAVTAPCRPQALMVFKSIRDPMSGRAPTWAFGTSTFCVTQGHPAYIPWRRQFASSFQIRYRWAQPDPPLAAAQPTTAERSAARGAANFRPLTRNVTLFILLTLPCLGFGWNACTRR